MNGLWLGAAGAGRQYAPAARIGRLRAAPQLHRFRRRCCSVRTSALVATTAAFGGFGPPLGLLIVFIGGLLYGLATDHAVGNMLPMFLPRVLIFFMPLAFTFGAVPALCAGLVIALLVHKHPGMFLGHRWRRAVLSGLIGAFIGALWALFSRRHFVVHQQVSTVAWNLLTDGVIAGVAASLLGIFFPRPAWVGAPSNNRWRGP